MFRAEFRRLMDCEPEAAIVQAVTILAMTVLLSHKWGCISYALSHCFFNLLEVKLRYISLSWNNIIE